MFTYADADLSQSGQQTGWQETLEQAQNTIFCKEIYNQVRNQNNPDLISVFQ